MKNNFKLSEEIILRLKEVVEKFPLLKESAKKFNESGVKWAIAAGTATYIYSGGDGNKLDDVDIWIASESKEKAAQVLDKEWQPQSSERHKAENITLNNLDIFTNCRKYQDGKLLLDYQWTNSVDEHLRITILDEINYQILAPEDVLLLKLANPREKDKEDINKLKKYGLDSAYLQIRQIECRYLPLDKSDGIV